MKVLRFSKHLNKTELGKGTTHEGYFYLNKQIAGKLLQYLPDAEIPIEFHEKGSQNKMITRLTIGREYRLPGLGEFFQSIDLQTEDLIVLEFRKDDGGGIDYFYEIKRDPNSIAVDFNDGLGFEILSAEEKISLLASAYVKSKNGEYLPISFGNRTLKKKREDSPEPTPFYDLLINGKAFNPKKNGTYLITVKEGVALIKPYNSWIISEGEE